MVLIQNILISFNIALIVLVSPVINLVHNESFSNEFEIHFAKRSEILSRRKRFLIFPEGSSLQLVFCLTFPSQMSIGEIFQYGQTAAMAWKLPQDPYSPFDHHADPLHRRADQKNLVYTDEKGRVLYSKPYRKRKLIVNPAFAKRSVNEAEYMDAPKNAKSSLKYKINRKRMHGSQTREFLKMEHMDGRSVEFHRQSRASLYRKIETLLKTMGANGRECLLKTLCQVGQTREQEQGSFLQEILRAVFTIPKGEPLDEDSTNYEEAHFATKSCDDLYPDCSEPLQDPIWRGY